MLNLSDMIQNINEFDQKALTWDADVQKQVRARIVGEAIREFLPPSKKLAAMEYGCGTGLLSFNLSADFETIYLADTSDGMLQVLSSKITSSGISNFKPIHLDLSNSHTFPKESIDVIFSLMTLHHVPDTSALLREFFTLLRPNGMILLADLEKEDGTFHPEGTTGIHYGFDRDELREKCDAAGFNGVGFTSVFTMQKKNREYPVFLLHAKRNK